jgi:hypothetical protein
MGGRCGDDLGSDPLIADHLHIPILNGALQTWLAARVGGRVGPGLPATPPRGTHASKDCSPSSPGRVTSNP